MAVVRWRSVKGEDQIDSEQARLLLARLLVDGRRRPRALDLDDPSISRLEPRTTAEAYLVDDLVAHLMPEAPPGWKIGCTSTMAQELLGSNGPFAGRVHTLVVADDHEPVAVPEPIAVEPLVEGEFAFRFHSDIEPTRDLADRATVCAAVESVHPAIELVGGRFSRFIDAPLGFVIADAGSNLMVAVGPGATLDDELIASLEQVKATMIVDGEVTGRGTGADVMGHPVEALVWLVSHLSARGIGIRAGQVVSTGTATGVARLEPGSTARLELGALGSVSVRR